MTRRAPQGEIVLVSWVSVGHLASPLLTVLDDRDSPYRGRVRRLYLCWRDAPAPDGDRERTALRESVVELRNALDPVGPEVVEVPWKTGAAPTDHEAIRPFAEQVLKRARDENPDALLVIHLSPGTPAMHAVWLVLGTTGFVDGDVALIQTADARGRAAGVPPVKTIRFDLDTWMRRFRATRPTITADDDDGHLWDPTRVQSPRLQTALRQLREWAPLRVPVLLIGERGTGKTTMAHFLRAMSPFQKKAQGAWPVVVCGQFRVNPQLARSELFGHIRGAFTGATKDRAGLLESADGDSLFLDEIADIDRDTQRLLMAAVEGRGFSRLGELKRRQSTFRLISATNRPLEVLRGTLLDEDFFDRIGVFILRVPSLRGCREDLPGLWRTVLGRVTSASGVRPAGWERFVEHEELLAMLMEHPLPGNFRDLQRAAYHLLAAVLAERNDQAVLAAARQALGPSDRAAAELDPARLQDELPLEGGLRTWLDERERAWLRAALDAAGGNKSKAARLLALSRKTFEHRLKNLAGD